MRYNYDYVRSLSFFNQPKLLRGLYSIILVSLVMTVFEIIFFRVIVQPETKTAVDGITQTLESATYDMAKNTIGENSWWSPVTVQSNGMYDFFESYLKTIEYREQVLVDTLNTYAYITASFMIFILLAILYYLHNRLENIEGKTHRLQVFGVDFRAGIITAILTVILLASFQVVFYFFGRQFKFVGTVGLDELIFTFNNRLRENLGMKIIEKK